MLILVNRRFLLRTLDKFIRIKVLLLNTKLICYLAIIAYLFYLFARQL
jgi:hypothetical protein